MFCHRRKYRVLIYLHSSEKHEETILRNQVICILRLYLCNSDEMYFQVLLKYRRNCVFFKTILCMRILFIKLRIRDGCRGTWNLFWSYYSWKYPIIFLQKVSFSFSNSFYEFSMNRDP